MSQFSFSRFKRVALNDALRIAKPVALVTLALLGLTVLIYLGSFRPGMAGQARINIALFPNYLLAAGLIFTSVSFQDLHHPLERYQYLMQPCSNIERFLSRYLLTGPLLVLYVTVAFSAMDWVGNVVTEMWKDAREPPFSPFSPQSLLMIRIYLLLHIVALTGAICFRSYSMIKTVLAVLAVMLGLAVPAYVGMRIFYWDSFSWTQWGPVSRSMSLKLMPMFDAWWINATVAGAFTLWMLYVAFRCLCGHQVQDEL